MSRKRLSQAFDVGTSDSTPGAVAPSTTRTESVYYTSGDDYSRALQCSCHVEAEDGRLSKDVAQLVTETACVTN